MATEPPGKAEEAVSPVIGVILMVAITVVLAAVVFVLVTQLNRGGTDSAPSIAFTVNDVHDRLDVASAATGADWSRLTAQVSSCGNGDATGSVIMMGGGASPFQNEAALDGEALNAANAAALPSACGAQVAVPITTIAPSVLGAGDYLEFCAQDTGAGSDDFATNVIVTIVDQIASTQIGAYTFSNIAGCA